MSIDLENWIRDAGFDPAAFVTNPRWTGSVRFTAGAIRALDLQVGWDPLERGGGFAANPYHGEVWGVATIEKQRQLQAMAEWFVQIDGVDIL